MPRRYRTWDDPPFAVQVALVTLAILAAAAGIYAAVTYERTVPAEVLDRWWNSSISVTYETKHTGVRSVPETVCIGDRCTVEVHTETYTYTTTHTRCRDSDSGRELPAVVPPVPCDTYWGDDVNRYVSYSIRYRAEETESTTVAAIKLDHWQRLEPGHRAKLVLNLFGNVRRLEME